MVRVVAVEAELSRHQQVAQEHPAKVLLAETTTPPHRLTDQVVVAAKQPLEPTERQPRQAQAALVQLLRSQIHPCFMPAAAEAADTTPAAAVLGERVAAVMAATADQVLAQQEQPEEQTWVAAEAAEVEMPTVAPEAKESS